jgi:hypothetical protein
VARDWFGYAGVYEAGLMWVSLYPPITVLALLLSLCRSSRQSESISLTLNSPRMHCVLRTYTFPAIAVPCGGNQNASEAAQAEHSFPLALELVVISDGSCSNLTTLMEAVAAERNGINEGFVVFIFRLSLRLALSGLDSSTLAKAREGYRKH